MNPTDRPAVPMSAAEPITMRWFYEVEPVYEHPYSCIASLVEINGRVAVPTGEGLLFLRSEGTLDHEVEIPDGTWGSPVLTTEGKIVIACQESSVALLDPATNSVTTGSLSASAGTPILPGPDAELFLGIGGHECAVVCLDRHLHMRWLRRCAVDEGLRHPMALDADGALWVPTDTGLLRLRADSGESIARSDPEKLFACVSNPVIDDAAALVVAVFRDGRCALVRVSGSGGVTLVRALPRLARAQLLPDRTSGTWLVGGSQDWQAPPPGDDFVWIARLDADGGVVHSHRCSPQTAVSLATDQWDRAWVGTYTYDLEGERGELYGLSADGQMHSHWRLEDPPSGIGAPLFLDARGGIVPTSNGVVGFGLPSGHRP